MKKKVELTARYEFVPYVGIKRNYEDVACVKVFRKDYERLLTSYASGFQDLREDKEISDLCALFMKEAELSEGEIKVLEYPEEVKAGIAFERMANPEAYYVPVQEYFEGPDGITYKSESDYIAAMEEKSNARTAGTEAEEEEKVRKAEELSDWMRENGFDGGELWCGLQDELGWYVDSVDIGWPDGIYGVMGFTRRVCVQYYHTTPELIELAKKNGYEVFTSIEEFKDFITRNCLRR